MRKTTLFIVLLAGPAAALAQQAESVGSWWIVRSNQASSDHAVMSMSTQASGVVAFRCSQKRPVVLVGINKMEFQARPGAKIRVGYKRGDAARSFEATIVSAETMEFDQSASRQIIAEAASDKLFSFQFSPAPANELTLVFRPVETKAAIANLASACAIKL